MYPAWHRTRKKKFLSLYAFGDTHPYKKTAKNKEMVKQVLAISVRNETNTIDQDVCFGLCLNDETGWNW